MLYILKQKRCLRATLEAPRKEGGHFRGEHPCVDSGGGEGVIGIQVFSTTWDGGLLSMPDSDQIRWSLLSRHGGGVGMLGAGKGCGFRQF